MKRTLLILAAGVAGALTLTAPAQAAPWQSINQREAQLNRRINQGVNNGSLTRTEARQLQYRFRRLAWLETRYRRTGGLSSWERRDLNRRFDGLSRSIRAQRHDYQNRRRWR